jgi:hypothetical protein
MADSGGTLGNPFVPSSETIDYFNDEGVWTEVISSNVTHFAFFWMISHEGNRRLVTGVLGVKYWWKGAGATYLYMGVPRHYFEAAVNTSGAGTSIHGRGAIKSFSEGRKVVRASRAVSKHFRVTPRLDRGASNVLPKGISEEGTGGSAGPGGWTWRNLRRTHIPYSHVS